MRFYDVLVEAIAAMEREPFNRQELLGWIAENHPQANANTASTQLNMYTVDDPADPSVHLTGNPPLLLRVGRGRFVRVQSSIDPASAPPGIGVAARATIWTQLAECVLTLREPFTQQEILSWFRRHLPDRKPESIRAHISGATSNAAPSARGAFASRTPLITRIRHGEYVRFAGDPSNGAADRPTPLPSDPTATDAAPTRAATASTVVTDEWYSEADVQSHIVAGLSAAGWRVRSVADTATKERGYDIVAERDGQTLAVEVKGYPSRSYADPRRVGERKKTPPSTQAGVWYASAILTAMRTRHAHPDWLCAIGLPDVPRYRNLFVETTASLSACGIQLLWVEEDGQMRESVAGDPSRAAEPADL